LRAVLNAHEGFLIVGEVGAGQELLQMLADSHPDLVIMDVRMPDVDAFAVIRAIRASQSAPDVILVTEEADRDVVLEALRAGVAAYLLKDASREELLATLCAVRAGQHRVQASLAADLLQAEAGTAQGPPPNQFPPAPGPLLSKREMDVLALVANGRKNDAIGRELGLSANTVKTHIKHIMRKLDSPDRAAAAAVAARMGLLEGLGLGA
jgi:DNA-binding NarL/FixJ family response regulator